MYMDDFVYIAHQQNVFLVSPQTLNLFLVIITSKISIKINSACIVKQINIFLRFGENGIGLGSVDHVCNTRQTT